MGISLKSIMWDGEKSCWGLVWFKGKFYGTIKGGSGAHVAVVDPSGSYKLITLSTNGREAGFKIATDGKILVIPSMAGFLWVSEDGETFTKKTMSVSGVFKSICYHTDGYWYMAGNDTIFCRTKDLVSAEKINFPYGAGKSLDNLASTPKGVLIAGSTFAAFYSDGKYVLPNVPGKTNYKASGYDKKTGMYFLSGGGGVNDHLCLSKDGSTWIEPECSRPVSSPQGVAVGKDGLVVTCGPVAYWLVGGNKHAQTSFIAVSQDVKQFVAILPPNYFGGSYPVYGWLLCACASDDGEYFCIGGTRTILVGKVNSDPLPAFVPIPSGYSLTVKYPTASMKKVKVGAKVPVKWTKSKPFQCVEIYSMRDDGKCKSLGDFSDNGSASITMPSVPMKDAIIKVIGWADNGVVRVERDVGPFEIVTEDVELPPEDGEIPAGYSLDLTYPVGGESIQAGADVKVTWKSGDKKFDGIQIEYTIDDTTWVKLGTQPDTGSYMFKLPNEESATAKVWIRGLAENNSVKIERFSKEFSVTEGQLPIDEYDLILTYPVGGEALVAGDQLGIVWSSPLSNFDAIQVEYTIDGAKWVKLGDQPDTDSFGFQLPDVASDKAQVWIRGLAKGGTVKKECYSGVFSIKTAEPLPEKKLDITMPQDGSQVVAGSQIMVNWSHENIDGDVGISVVHNGVSSAYIASIDAGSCSVLAPGLECDFQVTISAGGITKSLNLKAVEPEADYEIAVSEPIGGSVWVEGERETIRWASINPKIFDKIIIEYSIDGGLTFVGIIMVSDVGEYTMVAPCVESAKCMVRVTGEVTRPEGNGKALAVSDMFTMKKKDVVIPPTPEPTPTPSAGQQIWEAIKKFFKWIAGLFKKK